MSDQLPNRLAKLSLSADPSKPIATADTNSSDAIQPPAPAPIDMPTTAAGNKHRYNFRSRQQPNKQDKEGENADKQPFHFDAGVPAFTPLNGQQQRQHLSVSAKLLERLGVNKKRRTHQPNANRIAVPATAVDEKKGDRQRKIKREKQTKNNQKIATASQDEAGHSSHTLPPNKKAVKTPHLRLMKRPEPTHEYEVRAGQKPTTLDISRPLLVVLDLNGTLLYRPRRGSAFVARPHVHEFLDYLFSNHDVVVWSSARPENVTKMCEDLFTTAQHSMLLAIWARNKLGLTPEMYNEKVQVYKQLSWLWHDPAIQAKTPRSQADTVLIDDSIEKSASEPYNLIQIDEFDGNPQPEDEHLLSQVALYLDTLRAQADVSAYIKRKPFKYIPIPPVPM